MGIKDLESFFEKHCRFRLRSGKEVFGVVWFIRNQDRNQMVFSSYGDHEKYKNANIKKSNFKNRFNLMPVSPDDFIHAEPISE